MVDYFKGRCDSAAKIDKEVVTNLYYIFNSVKPKIRGKDSWLYLASCYSNNRTPITFNQSILVLVFRRGRFDFAIDSIQVVSNFGSHKFVIKVSDYFPLRVTNIINELFYHGERVSFLRDQSS